MKNVWIWVVAAIVVIGGGYWYWQSAQGPSNEGSEYGAPSAAGTGAGSQTSEEGGSANVGTNVNVSVNTAPATASVTYDGNKFSPSQVTVKKGGTVTFTSAAGAMWVATAPHPAHTGYDGTSASVHCAAGYKGAAPFDECAAGASYNFTFNKTGTWPYHNHLNESTFGKIVVVE